MTSRVTRVFPKLGMPRKCGAVDLALATKLLPSPVHAPVSEGAYALEPHFAPEELAETWHVSGNTIRDLFEHEPGVLKITRPERLHKRRYVTLRIPASVAKRVHARLDAGRRITR
jgi:hypothetical protein